MDNFFEIDKSGNKIPFKFSAELSKQKYKTDSFFIWGGSPLDVAWAINTQVWKEYINKKEYLKQRLKTLL